MPQQTMIMEEDQVRRKTVPAILMAVDLTSVTQDDDEALQRLRNSCEGITGPVPDLLGEW